MKFFKCEHCGKIITMLSERAVPTVCCGDPMKELIPGTTDAAVEKHVPVVKQDGGIVTVEIGSVAHPMAEEHHIEWIVLETSHGCQMKKLAPGEEPKAVFALSEGEKIVAAYEYCNLHGLWKN